MANFDSLFSVGVGADISLLQTEMQKAENLLAKFEAAAKKATNIGEINYLNGQISGLNSTITNLGNEMNKAGKPIGDATQSLINFSRIAQDAPYGIQGVANNLNPMLESFQRLAATEGGTTKALKAMVLGLSGPAGVGVALGIISSLAVTFSKQLSEMFQTPTEKMKEFRDELKKLGDDVYKIVGGSQANRAVAMGFSAIAGSDNKSLEERKTALKYLKDIYKDNKEIQDLTIKSGTQYMNYAINRAAKQEEYQNKEKNNASSLKVIYTEIAKLEDERNKALGNVKQEYGAGGIPMYNLKAVKQRINDTYDAQIKIATDKLPEALRAGAKLQSALVGYETPDKIAKPKKEKKDTDYIQKLINKSKEPIGGLENVGEDTAIKDSEKAHQDYLDNLSKFYKFKINLTKKDYEENQKILKKQEQDMNAFADKMASSITGAIKSTWDAIQSGKNVFDAISESLMKFIEELGFAILKAQILADIQNSMKTGSGGSTSADSSGGGIFDLLFTLLKVVPFANGGVVSKPTFSMIGEAGPEAVMPLSKLSGMMNSTFNAGAMSGQSTGGNGQFVLRGQDLLVAINRTQKSSFLKGQNISLV
jgi:hypothetical protein